jgi:flavodoxin
MIFVSYMNGYAGTKKAVDAVSYATSAVHATNSSELVALSGTLICLASFHHHNPGKIAKEIASVLDARIVNPQHISVDNIAAYKLIGFGSGIYDQKHHKMLLDLVDTLTFVEGKKVFIFSTSGVSRETAITNSIEDPHTALREKLKSKGCIVVDEFNCPGWNTNGFLLKLFGGINRGRPNAEDLNNARIFAGKLKQLE